MMTTDKLRNAMLQAMILAALAASTGAGANEVAPPEDAAVRRLQAAETGAREAQAANMRTDPEIRKHQALARAAQAKAAREREKRIKRGI